MSKKIKCRMVSPLLSAYISGELEDQKAMRVQKHISRCVACGKTADAIKRVVLSGVGPGTDLWPRLASRLAQTKQASQTDRYMPILFPSFTWREATAMAIVVLTLAVVPEPLRFLVVLGVI